MTFRNLLIAIMVSLPVYSIFLFTVFWVIEKHRPNRLPDVVFAIPFLCVLVSLLILGLLYFGIV